MRQSGELIQFLHNNWNQKNKMFTLSLLCFNAIIWVYGSSRTNTFRFRIGFHSLRSSTKRVCTTCWMENQWGCWTSHDGVRRIALVDILILKSLSKGVYIESRTFLNCTKCKTCCASFYQGF